MYNNKDIKKEVAKDIKNRSKYCLTNTIYRLNKILKSDWETVSTGGRFNLTDVLISMQNDPYKPLTMETWNFAPAVLNGLLHDYKKTLKPRMIFNVDTLYRNVSVYLSGNKNYKMSDTIRHFGKPLNQNIKKQIEPLTHVGKNPKVSYSNVPSLDIVMTVDRKHHKAHIKALGRSVILDFLKYAQKRVVSASTKYINAQSNSAIKFKLQMLNADNVAE